MRKHLSEVDQREEGPEKFSAPPQPGEETTSTMGMLPEMGEEG